FVLVFVKAAKHQGIRSVPIEILSFMNASMYISQLICHAMFCFINYSNLLKSCIGVIKPMTLTNYCVDVLSIIFSYAYNDSLLLTPLCCDDIHDVTPRVFALAGCDILMLEDGTEFYMLAERRFIQKQLDEMLSVLRIMKLRWLDLKLYCWDKGSSSVCLDTTQQMVISSPCIIHIKNWLVQKQMISELASPKQTTLGKDISNPLMAGRQRLEAKECKDYKVTKEYKIIKKHLMK
nr:hypothetical protein [Tanacetum cinerariifolium]